MWTANPPLHRHLGTARARCTAAGSAAMIRSMSALVVDQPNENRTPPRAASASRPIASSTSLGPWTPARQADPEEHMSRVIAQGDTRPMAANPEAMDDLRRILDGRAEFYSKADHMLDTTGQSLQQSFARLRQMVAA